MFLWITLQKYNFSKHIQIYLQKRQTLQWSYIEYAKYMLHIVFSRHISNFITMIYHNLRQKF